VEEIAIQQPKGETHIPEVLRKPADYQKKYSSSKNAKLD
jgi:hypothetical protein